MHPSKLSGLRAFARPSVCRRRMVRGVSLVEVAIAMLVISITVITMFSVFAANQSSLVGTIKDQKLNQVVRNEAERILSLNYNQIVDSTLTAEVDGETYTLDVTVTVVQLTANPTPVVKRVTVTGTHTASGDSTSVDVVKAP